MEKSIYSEDYAVFLKHLRAARKKAGMTQTALARRLGQAQPFVSKIERGERRLDVVEVYRICKILKTDFPAFMSRLIRHPSAVER
jgi:transcriptional regulator with XRE-family HTH domain